jgi:hypothetical protein
MNSEVFQSVRSGSYYQLVCKTCDEIFKPMLATSPDELLYPDYEATAEEAGTMNADSLRSFHERHRECALTTRDA